MAIPELARLVKVYQIAIAERLRPLGFERARLGNDFDSSLWRRGGVCSVRFGIGVVDYEAVLYLGATAGIRFEEIEAVCNKASELPEEMHAETCTLDAPNLVPGRKAEENIGRLAVDTPGANVDLLLAETDRVFASAVVPFFGRFKSLQDVDAVLNSQPTVPSPYLVPAYERCCRGLVAARLVRRKDIQHLLSIYSDSLRREANGFYLKKFTRLVALLGLE